MCGGFTTRNYVLCAKASVLKSCTGGAGNRRTKLPPEQPGSGFFCLGEFGGACAVVFEWRCGRARRPIFPPPAAGGGVAASSRRAFATRRSQQVLRLRCV